MLKVLLHPKLENNLENLSAHNNSKLLLVSPDKDYSYQVSKIISDRVENSIVLNVESKNSIGIDQIRNLKKFLKTQNTDVRVIVINNSHEMTEEAQNSLLKILEENPDNSMFILTSISEDELIDTLLSRVTTIKLFPPTLEQAKQAYPDISDMTTVYRLSEGWPSRYKSYSNFDEVDDLQIAKEILSEKKFNRLVRVSELSKDKAKTINILSMLAKIYQQLLRQSIVKNKETNTNNYSAKIEMIIDCKRNISNNGSIKGNLSYLFSNL